MSRCRGIRVASLGVERAPGSYGPVQLDLKFRSPIVWWHLIGASSPLHEAEAQCPIEVSVWYLSVHAAGSLQFHVFGKRVRKL